MFVWKEKWFYEFKIKKSVKNYGRIVDVMLLVDLEIFGWYLKILGSLDDIDYE